MEKYESAEEKTFIISHNALSKAKASFDWSVLSRADHVQHFSSDCDCNLFAFYSAPGIIDLWDLSTSPVALAFLNVPSRSAHIDHYEENECRCINWSRCKKYALAIFWIPKSALTGEYESVLHLWDVSSGLVITSLRLQLNVVSASFISELPNMVLLSSKMMITDSQVLLDCCSREMKRVNGWGEPNSSNIITEDLPKAAYASQPQHLEMTPILSSDSGPEPGCLSSEGNVDRLCVPVFCVSALSQHLPSDLDTVAAGEVTQSAFISTLGYAYVSEIISRPVDATTPTPHLGESGSGESESDEEVIKKVQISTRPMDEDDVQLFTKCLIHDYTESVIEESSRDVHRGMRSDQSLLEKSSQLPSSDHDCVTLAIPTLVTETFKDFVSRSGICSMKCILSVCVYRNSSSLNIRVRSLKTSLVPYCSETNREAYEILLVTGCGQDPVSGDVSDTLCDVRVLDSSLKTLAVLSMDDPCAFTAVTSSTYQCHELSVSLPLLLSPSLPAEGEGQGEGEGVESQRVSESKATSLDMPWRSAAINLITSACLVPAICVPQSSYSSKLGEIAVALVTAYSKDRPLLSSKLLFWQPDIRSDAISKISSLEEKEKGKESGCIYTQECISTAAMAANCSDLPFVNMPARSGARKDVAGLGSRGPHMLASTSGTGQHQYLVLGDVNGHVWGTTIGSHTDFPGPMYPPGFTLMQRVESYLEREDELDNVNVLPSNSLAERPSCDPSYECLHSASDSHPFIDVGVSPYFLKGHTDVFLIPPSNVLCAGHTVVSRFCQRLPLRLLGSARDVMLERKARALILRKASMARVRVPSAASRKRSVTARGGNTKLNNKKKKKKLSFVSMSETQEHNSTDDNCAASGTSSFLPLLPPSYAFTDGAAERGEPGLFTSAPSPSPLPLPSLLQGCTGTKADEADTDRLDVDVVDGPEGTHSLIKVSGGSSRDGDRNGDRDVNRPQHDDSEDSESDNESVSVPLIKPSSHPGDAEARPTLDPLLSVALSDVLPVPRRVLTGDFAVRLLKAKEVGLAITMKRLSGTVLAERLLQIEREAVENTRKDVMKKEKGRLRVIKNRVEKAAAKRLVEENAAAAAAAIAASAIPHMPTMMQIPAAEGSAEDEKEKEKALEVVVTVKDADTCHELAGERECVWLAEIP